MEHLAIAHCPPITADLIIMAQVKFSIKKVSTGMMLTVWEDVLSVCEDALTEEVRIRPITYKMNFRCLNMIEAKARLELVTNGDWGFNID